MAKFNRSMVTDAQIAAEAMKNSPIAAKLAENGFTPEVMSEAAKALSDLRTQVQMAKAAMIQASAALQAKSTEFALQYATYANLVRGFTPEKALRRVHGVKSLGGRSRRTKQVETPATAPAEPQGSNGAANPTLTNQ